MEYGDVIQKKDTIPSNDDKTEGILAKMAKYPEVEITVIKHKNGNENRTQINGDSDKVNLEEQDEYTSDEELLIIDETLDKNQWNRDHCKSQSPCGRANFKGFKKQSSDLNSTSILKLVTDLEKSVHVGEPEKYSIDSNCDNAEGYQIQGESSRTLNDSIFQINGSNSDSLIKDDDTNNTDQKYNFSQKILNDINSVNKNKLSEFQRQKQPTSTCSKMTGKKPNKKRPSQKLTEYAQYLGLQPAVKFKCVKCSESSFPSLTALNDHQRQCLVQPAVSKPTATPATVTSSSAPSTNFRVTRKVFLCSSCGTYYENCNLFLHMREVHKRYICLYCLGMFSLPEKLSHHLATKHNCSASKFSSANEFLNSNTESCYLICCNCERVFSERDNFFDHVCLEKRTTTTEKTNKNVEQLANLQAQKLSKSTIQKLPDKRMKLTKNNSKNFSHVEHITADSLVTRLTSPGPEQEASAAEHFMAEVLNSNPKNDSENSVDKPANPESADDNDENGEGHCESAENVTQVDVESSKEQTCEENTEEPSTEPNPIVVTNVDKEIESENENLAFSDNENMEENKKQESDHGISDRSVDSVTQMAGDFNDISDNENFCNNTSDEKNESFSETQESKEILETEKKVDSDEISAVRKSPSIETEENKQTDEALDLKESSNDNEETRKVPKVTLKLPLPGLVYSENESDDSEKLTMEIEDNAESDRDCDEAQTDSLKISSESEKPVNGYDENLDENTDPIQSEEEYYQVAGEEVPVVELELEQPLDKFDVTSLLKICLEATVPTCVYCNHARKIAVNGKQLGLHAMAEHRFAATVNSITAEELIPENFVARIKESLGELESSYFSLEEKTSEDGKDENEEDKFKRVYECFQCRYATSIHKELYLHNRKMHAKTILLCIMCKSNFYSYSELICHLCPGNYVLNSETKFRCCMCDSKYLPSAFRLMVHLRKRHHTCDVCLEGCYNQSKLSNHVWKHKLHHLCYRCGIAYRNKPDITKHLFWKHGTESVLCKKCLQKKWPHVYHFCIPPASFACEECNVNFSKAVYLKVHKRIHNNEKPHNCTVENCEQSFISKKLMLKHEKRHREPESEILDNPLNNDEFDKGTEVHDNGVTNDISSDNNKQEKSEKCDNSSDKDETKQKNIIDVYNLPALNLSESDSDDSENEKPKICSEQQSLDENKNSENSLTDIIPVRTEPAVLEEEQKPIPILDGIWDNFKNYQATIEKRDSLNSELYKAETNTEEPMCTNESNVVESDKPNVELILAEHDYCVVYEKNEPSQEDTTTKPKTDESTEMDHDYCTVTQNETEISTSELNNSSLVEDKAVAPQDNLDKKKNKPQKKKIKHGSSSSSDSSTDSDSSSCTCGSNCSCSSSSGSSSTSSSSSDSESSSSEGKRRILARRERHKERAKRKKESETSQAASNNSAVDVVDTENITAHIPAIELPIQESDLETVESETDEDFYDEYPQRLANKMMAEKRNQLAILASVAPVSNGTIVESSRPSTPSIPEEISTSKKKLKSKKRKRKSRSSTPKQEFHDNDIPNYLNHKTPLSVQPSLSAVPTIPQSVQSIISHSTAMNVTKLESSSKALLVHNPGSGSETDTNLRSSKRKRVPNKFYGYSSDEEANEKTPTAASLKWRKLEPPPTVVSHVTASPHLVPPITIKSVPSPAPALVTEPVNRAPIIRHEAAESGDSDDDDIHRSHTKSSSESSGSVHDSDSDTGQLHISQPDEYGMVPRQATQTERTNENLYCYCQCPYDEVSEMIACDGKDCAIEWFHFECVGIMVPPKGKWYCPDCRKKMHMHRSETVQV